MAGVLAVSPKESDIPGFVVRNFQPRYGNWGGKGGGGGQWITKFEDQFVAPPIDFLDAAYQRHDYDWGGADFLLDVGRLTPIQRDEEYRAANYRLLDTMWSVGPIEKYAGSDAPIDVAYALRHREMSTTFFVADTILRYQGEISKADYDRLWGYIEQIRVPDQTIAGLATSSAKLYQYFSSGKFAQNASDLIGSIADAHATAFGVQLEGYEQLPLATESRGHVPGPEFKRPDLSRLSASDPAFAVSASCQAAPRGPR